MRPTPLKSSPKPVNNRLGLKLTALFTGTFLAVFIGLLFYDLFLMFQDNTKVEATSASPITAIDPKLESDLAKVLEFKDAQNTADIKNPFADQGGISDKANPAAAVNTPQSSAAVVKTNNPAQNNQPRYPASQNVAAKTVQNQATPEPVITTKMRLDLREEKIRVGQDPGPESLVYAIDDLLPVGVVGGGDGKEEVMFYSVSACRVVSFPVGTQFYDGWLDAQRSEGVVFGFFDQNRTMRMRGWGRSVNTQCTQTVSTNESGTIMSNGGSD